MRSTTLALGALIAAALLSVIGATAGAKPKLRVGYVTYAGVTPTERDLYGAPLLGFVQALKEFDVQGRVVYIPPNQDLTAPLESLARQKYDLILVGIAAVNPVYAVARRFPRVRFVMPDSSVNALRRPLPNVQGTVFRAEEAAYLTGYLAALMEGRRAGRHVVSSVGGFQIAGVDRWILGFNAGARKADPRVARLTGYSSDFTDAEKCRTVALSQIARGSGVVFNVAGGCGLGALAAARARGVWGVGVDIDQSFLGRHILTSAVVRLERPVVDAIRRLVRGTFTTGGDTVYDLRNGGVGLGKISPAVPRTFLGRLSEIRRQIVEGEIQVPRVKRI